MSSSSKYMRFSLSRRGGFIRRTGRTIGIRAVPQRLYEKIVGELFPGRIYWRPETARNKIFSAVRISLLSNSKTRKRGTNLSRDSFGSVISKLGIFTFSECEVLNLYLVVAASFYYSFIETGLPVCMTWCVKPPSHFSSGLLLVYLGLYWTYESTY